MQAHNTPMISNATYTISLTQYTLTQHCTKSASIAKPAIVSTLEIQITVCLDALFQPCSSAVWACHLFASFAYSNNHCWFCSTNWYQSLIAFCRRDCFFFFLFFTSFVSSTTDRLRGTVILADPGNKTVLWWSDCEIKSTECGWWDKWYKVWWWLFSK